MASSTSGVVIRNLKNSMCAGSLTCQNTPGSFVCGCAPGYMAIGTECADVNECLSINGGCGSVAACQNTAGGFTCSDERLDQLHHNVEWSLRSNFVDTPTDCPTRERSGWTGFARLEGQPVEALALLSDGAACALGADWSGLHFMVGAFLAGTVVDADWFDQQQMDQLRAHVLLVIMPVFFLSTGLRTQWGVGGAAVFLAAALLLPVPPPLVWPPPGAIVGSCFRPSAMLIGARASIASR